MKQLEKKDLIIGEVYKHENGNLVKYQFDGDINGKIKGSYIGNNANKFYKQPDNNFTISCLKLATPEEKHWLNTCIEADKFISYEEAMKTFVPEYVECIRQLTGITIGKILPVKNNMVIDGKFNNYSMKAGDIYNYFKPSTKEAYDAQFVVKEPEFVLPEKWCIKSNEQIYDILQNYCSKNIGRKPLDKYKRSVYHFPDFWGCCTNSGIFRNYTEITFEQFKKYVLKEESTEEFGNKINKQLLEEPKDKVLEYKGSKGAIYDIKKVECAEGSIYKIGDKIKVFTHDSPNKGKVSTIKRFRWTNDKSKICAVTELYFNGIDLDKIELYSEPVVKELSLLEQAKLKYPIGTKFKPLNTDIICEITTGKFKLSGNSIWEVDIFNDNIYSNGACHYIYSNNPGFAEIIVEDFKLPEKWCVKRTIDNFEIINNWCNNNHIDDEHNSYIDSYGYIHSERCNNSFNSFKRSKGGTQDLSFTEITFEQFKKYVLNETLQTYT